MAISFPCLPLLVIMMAEGKSWHAVAIVPSQGHVLMIALLAVLALEGGDVLPPVPEDGLPSLELTLGRRRACSVPLVRRCHIGLLPPLSKLVLRQGRVVLSAHAGLP